MSCGGPARGAPGWQPATTAARRARRTAGGRRAAGGLPAAGLRWTRSSLVAAASGVALCVLVAAIAVARTNGPSGTAASAAGSTTTAPSAAGPGPGGSSGPGPAASSAAPGRTHAGAAAGGNTGPAPAPAGVKGVGTVGGPAVSTDLASSGATWYYNWAATPGSISTPPGVAYVPMIKTAADVNAATLNEVEHEGKYLLGFNEPNEAGQADLTVDQALALWPRLEATGMELGSPAVSYGTNSTTSWIGQFMDGARARGYRVNFITVHWYGQHHWTSPAANVTELKNYLEQTYSLYHMPIWITEFSLISFANGTPVYPTAAQQAAFLTPAAKMLATLPFVQRYAWYTLTGNKVGGTTILYNNGTTTPTTVESAYKQAAQ